MLKLFADDAIDTSEASKEMSKQALKEGGH